MTSKDFLWRHEFHLNKTDHIIFKKVEISPFLKKINLLRIESCEITWTSEAILF